VGLHLCLLKTPCDAQSLIIFPSEAGSRSRMLELIFGLLSTARSSFKGQRELAPENLALRQQLAILKRNTNRPRLTWIASSGSMSQRQPYPASCLGIENHPRRPRAGLHSKSYCERVIGSIRRECLNHVVVLGERHLLRILREYVSYFTPHAPTCRWARTPPITARSWPMTTGTSLPCQWSAACTTNTSAARPGKIAAVSRAATHAHGNVCLQRHPGPFVTHLPGICLRPKHGATRRVHQHLGSAFLADEVLRTHKPRPDPIPEPWKSAPSLRCSCVNGSIADSRSEPGRR